MPSGSQAGLSKSRRKQSSLGKLSHRVLGADCNTFDVVVGVIHRVDESPAFIHFVGMLVGSCFKAINTVL